LTPSYFFYFELNPNYAVLIYDDVLLISVNDLYYYKLVGS